MLSKNCFSIVAALALLWAAPAHAQGAAAGETETQCTDGVDNDNDTVYDCGDADCKEDPACQKDGAAENTEARCSDWVDNDGNGFTDCDDVNCQGPQMATCQGSWQGKSAPGVGQASNSSQLQPAAADLPDIDGDMSVEDLIGRAGDNDGERNNVLCSDGVDNDGDGRTDCADFGCRFDASVTVCQGDPNFRFGVVARVEGGRDFENDVSDARFSTLQIRALGPMPFIQDSFFLLSMRAEKTPRLTFAMFQVPLGDKGHYMNINSGTGGLSLTLARSQHKRLLLEPAFFVYNAFEQGNGAAFEIGGPFDAAGRFLWRTYVSGGTGRFSGNVGGGFVNDATDNFSYSVGGQVIANLIGYYSRWDSPMLYTPAQTALTVSLGAKYDQRSQERYPAVNAQVALRLKRFMFLGESYVKRELDFGQTQMSYVGQVGFLAWPKKLLLAADWGEYLTSDFENPPAMLPADLARQLQESQFRAAAHFYLWKNILVASVLYADRRVDPRPGETEEQVTRELKAIAQYRF